MTDCRPPLEEEEEEEEEPFKSLRVLDPSAVRALSQTETAAGGPKTVVGWTWPIRAISVAPIPLFLPTPPNDPEPELD